MSQTNSTTSLTNAIEFVVSAYEAGTKGAALTEVAKTAAKKFRIKTLVIQEGVRAHLKEKSQPTPAQPISEVRAAMREYNSGKVSFSEPKEIARPNVDGLKVPACPKCGGEMHAFFAKDGREFWGCRDKKCRGIRRIFRPLTEEEAEAKAYAPYLK